MDTDAHRRRLELVLEGTRLGMWDWNPQTNAVVFDQRWAEMLGHALDEIEPALESWSSRVHPDDLDSCYADIQAHMEGRTPFYENVHRMRHKDGHWVHILDRGRIAERDDQGRPTRFTGTHTNITAQREAEFRALALARGRTRFLANMSHEIRTPLHGMIGLLETLDAGGLSEEQKETIAVVRRVGEGLVTLVNDVLDFAKAGEGKLRLSRSPFQPSQVVDEVAALYREQLHDGVSMVVDIAPDVGTHVFGDGHRLRQVLANLVSNAVKFTREGLVLILVDRDTDAIRFRVRDTGPGVADLDRLFQPYDQLSDSTARQFGGTGLGLAISKHLVELADGTIDVASTPGSGTEFTVVLPMPVVSAPVVDAGPAHAEGLPFSSILVADDNAVNRMVFEGLLEPAGVDVELVNDGVEAVRVASRPGASFHLLLLDLHMPELNGDEVLHELRRQGIHTPAIVASADALHETRARCLEAGFADFLPKPFKSGELFTVLRRVWAACAADDCSE